jgi:very-short-patch-repair endonuclease
MRKHGPPRSEVAALADRQCGYVKRVQLLALGAGPEWIRSQMLRGWLIRVHAGVYAVGHVPRDAHARAYAAVLACGDSAALSHASAAALWGVGKWPLTPEVTALRQVRRPGIHSHQSQRLGRKDIRTHQGIRVTAPLRTVLDLQPRLTDPQLIRLVNELRVGRHLNSGAFEDVCARSPRVNGLLGGSHDNSAAHERPTRSALEDTFRRFTRHHNLPMPQISAILPHNGREVDALYPAQKLIVEVDSWKYHSSRASFERDRAKDADALEHGYRTLRVTNDRLAGDGAQEAARIHRILGSETSETQ